MPVQLDPFAPAVTPLTMYSDGTKLSRGTAFFWEDSGIIYLVTNWHNFSGRHPFTSAHLSTHAGEPNRVEFDVFRRGDLNKRRTFRIHIIQDDRPIWLEHPIYAHKVDVVCLPVDLGAYRVFPINQLEQSQIAAHVADDVFILGYPMGINTFDFVVWKRASIASEPNIDAEALPMFYVDTATARGMSGSPVVRRATSGSGLMENGSFTVATGAMSRFLGITPDASLRWIETRLT